MLIWSFVPTGHSVLSSTPPPPMFRIRPSWRCASVPTCTCTGSDLAMRACLRRSDALGRAARVMRCLRGLIELDVADVIGTIPHALEHVGYLVKPHQLECAPLGEQRHDDEQGRDVGGHAE